MKKILYSVMALAIATLTFTACEDVPEPYPTPTKGDKPVIVYDGEGTLEKPYTVADAIKYARSFGQAESDQSVYIKGFITAITEVYNTNYGNAAFEISDTKDGANKFTFYRGLYLGNKKFTNGNTQIKVGDEVIVYGPVVNFKGNIPETVQGSAYLYSLNGVTSAGGGDDKPAEVKGTGTLEDPFNAAGAVAYAKEVGDKESDKDVYIKGKVASITEQYGTDYGNASFTISDDGAAVNDFTVYRALYLGNKKYTTGKLLNQGDEVIVCGKVTNFKGNTPETVQGKAYLYSLNGEKEVEGGTTPTPPAGNVGSIDNPVTVAAALTAIDALADGATSTEWYYIKGKVKNIKTAADNIAQYKNIDYYITDDGNNEIQIFRGKNIDNSDFTSADQLNTGDEVIVFGQIMKFKDNSGKIVPEMAQGNYIVKLTKGSGNTPSTPETPVTPGAGEGSYSQPFSVADVIAKGADNKTANVYVKAFIVGWIDGKTIEEGAKFTGNDVTVASNIIIADAANVTDISKCVPVQLPSGAVRTGLNLKDNPTLIGKEVILYGNLEKYFGVAGVKSVSYAECNGAKLGTQP